MRLPNLSGLAEAAQKAVARFPLPMLASIVGAAALSWAVGGSGAEERTKDSLRIAMAASLALPLLTALAVFSERNAHSAAKKWLLQAIGAAIAVGLWATFDLTNGWPSDRSGIRLAIWSLLFHLLVAVAPYLSRSARVSDFWEYNKQLLSNFFVGAGYSAVIFLGLSAALAASDALFEAIQFEPKTYARLFFWVAGAFQTAYFLSAFPADHAFGDDEIRYSRSTLNLVKFILIPIVGLYFLILYAYSAKIIRLWSLPKGWVSALVIGFSGAGIFTWLLNFYLPQTDSARILSGFKKWLWPALFPMVGLLFVAVGRRLFDYGVTEPRFVGATAGVWLAVLSLYFLFSKAKDLRAVPLTMAGFAAICLLPGIGMFDASERSQVNELADLLAASGRFDGPKLLKKDSLVRGEAADRAVSILHFLARRDALGRIWHLAPTATDSLFSKNDRDPWGYERASSLARELGFDPSGASPDFFKVRHFYAQTGQAPLAIRGFDRLQPFAIHSGGADVAEPFRLGSDGRSLIAARPGKTEQTVDLGPHIERAWRLPPDVPMSQADAVWEIGPGFRLVVGNAQIEKPADRPVIVSLSGWAMWKD